MASESETLDIGKLRSAPPGQAAHPGMHARSGTHEAAYDPERAAQARARIDALPQHPTLPHPDAVPAAPTKELVTDKHKLATSEQARVATSGRRMPSALGPVLAAVGIFAITLLLFKSPIILSQLGYSLGNKNAQTTSTNNAGTLVPADNTISIPKINVNAPVVYQPSMVEADIQRSLQDGVVHYGSTALPGQAGNVAIFGHSSNDWWEPGNYKFVFVLLDKIAPGDKVFVDYQSKRYTYEVTGSKVVDPTDVAVLAPTPTPTLTLITCSPPGTSLRRLVVTAKQIDPTPDTAVKVTTPKSSSGSSLPSAAPGFFNQVKSAWNGVWQGISSLFGGDTSGPAPSNSPSSGTPDTLPTIK
jgi:sortase A